MAHHPTLPLLLQVPPGPAGVTATLLYLDSSLSRTALGIITHICFFFFVYFVLQAGTVPASRIFIVLSTGLGFRGTALCLLTDVRCLLDCTSIAGPHVIPRGLGRAHRDPRMSTRIIVIAAVQFSLNDLWITISLGVLGFSLIFCNFDLHDLV